MMEAISKGSDATKATASFDDVDYRFAVCLPIHPCLHPSRSFVAASPRRRTWFRTFATQTEQHHTTRAHDFAACPREHTVRL